MKYMGKEEGNSLEPVLDDIESGRGVSCYLLYGDDEYRIMQAAKRIVDALLPDENRDFNLFRLDGERSDAEAICQSVMTPPLLPGRKVVEVVGSTLFASQETIPDVVNNIISAVDKDPAKAVRAFGVFLHMTGWSLEELADDGWRRISDDVWHNTVGAEGDTGRDQWLPKVLEIAGRMGMHDKPVKDDAAFFEQVLAKGFPEGNYLIITAEYVDRRKRLFKVFSEYGLCLPFARVKKEEDLKRQFLQSAGTVLEQSGKKLTPVALEALGSRTGFDLRETMKALESLITHAGDRVMIDEDDVGGIVEKTKEDSLFELTNAMVTRNMEKALATYENLLNHGVHHLVILAMIGREIRMMLQAKLLLQTGAFASFTPRMTFNQFRTTVFPRLQMMKDQDRVTKRSLLGQHPYAIYNVFIHANAFSYEALTAYLDTVGTIDSALKTTGKNPDLLIERLLIEICRPMAADSGSGARDGAAAVRRR
jgi:DNA polymerase-3 subunit delta